MTSYLDEAAITGVQPAGTKKPLRAKADVYLDEFAITGVTPPAPTALQQVGGFLTDKDSWKGMGKTAGQLGLATADMLLGIPGMALGVGASLGARGRALLSGESRKTQETAGALAKEMIPQGLSIPLQTIAQQLGLEPLDQSAMANIIEKGGEAVDRLTRGVVSTQDAKDLFDIVMLYGGAKGTDVMVAKALEPKARSSVGARESYTEVQEPTAVDLTPETPAAVYARAPYRQPVAPLEGPLTPEAAIAASKQRIADMKAAVKDEAPADRAARGAALPEGEALWKLGDAEIPVTVTGAPLKGPDGRAYTPVLQDGKPTFVPAEQLQPKPPEVQVGLPAPRAPTPVFEGVPKQRATEGVILGETPPALETGLAKVKAGQSFALLPEEKIALDATSKAAGRIVGLDGKPLGAAFTQKGNVDPRLLAAMGISSAAVYAAMNPEAIAKLSSLGLIGVTAGIGKHHAIGPLLESIKPYTFTTLERIPKGWTEVTKEQLMQRLNQADVSKAERDVLTRVMGEREKISAKELVEGVAEETASWRLAAEPTSKYADYGLENIDREPLGRRENGYVVGGREASSSPSQTTLYRLPEHMELSDANHFGDARLFGWTRSFREDGVRHVVELQSDLAQHAKGAVPEAERAVLMEKATENEAAIKRLEQKLNNPASWGPQDSSYNLSDALRTRRLLSHEIRNKLEATAIDSQVSPIIKHWPRRLIREELVQAANGGESSVRFASADTVAKVEGWGGFSRGDEANLVQRIARIDQELPIYKNHPELAASVIEDRAYYARALEELKVKEKVFEDPGHQSIYNRYAGEILKYLKSLGGKEVRDYVGHTWIEVPTSAVRTPAGPRVKMLGAADPKLLAKLALGTGAAAAIATSDDPASLAALGAGALGVTKGVKGLKSLPEADLIKAAKEGSQAALSELYTRNEPQLRRSLQSFERSGVDVDEIVQRTLLNAFKNLDQFRGDSKLSTWLHTAGQNFAKMSLRGKKLQTTELTPELAETLGHSETPLKALQNKGLRERLAAALERIPPQESAAFLAVEGEGLSYAEAGAKLGVAENTIAAQVSRAKAHMRQLLKEGPTEEPGIDGAAVTPRRTNQDGKIDPRLSIALGAASAGAFIGGMTDPQNSVRNTIYGALAGGILGTAQGRATLRKIVEKPDEHLGLISTRLGNIALILKQVGRRHELNVFKATERVNNAALPFIEALKTLPKEAKDGVKGALLDSDFTQIKAIPALAKTYPAVQQMLRTIEHELQGLGRFGEGIVNYFPRLVKDFEGLKAAIGQEATQGLETALIKAEAAMIRKRGEGLTELEQSIVTNRYLSAADLSSSLPGYAKGRRLQTVPAELRKFYEDPTESLLRYMSAAVNDIEIARFFGKDLKTKSKNGKIFTDLDSSIGNYTNRLMQEGKITREQAAEVRSILKSRFEGGEQAMPQGYAAVRNITNTALLGNFTATATQIADPLLTFYHHGFVPTLQAVAEKVAGKSRVTPKDLGLINHLAEELSNLGLTGRVLHKVLGWSGFRAIDMFGKEININAALIKNEQALRTPAGQAAFRAKYGELFGKDIETAIADIRARRRSDLSDFVAFDELSDAQAISKMEMTQAYLNHPRGRMLYQLKTYMLKQIDIVRRDAYQEIAKGTPSKIAKGTKNLMALGGALALANIPSDVVKDLLSGREVDPFTTPKLVENVLQTFGLNRYSQQRLGQGKIVDTAVATALPPLKVIENIAQAKPEAVGYLPLGGRMLYDRKFGGNERREIYEARLDNAGKPKGTGRKLSPEAKAYLKKKRDERERAKKEAAQ